jgi:hypothetical protein
MRNVAIHNDVYSHAVYHPSVRPKIQPIMMDTQYPTKLYPAYAKISSAGGGSASCIDFTKVHMNAKLTPHDTEAHVNCKPPSVCWKKLSK